MIPPKKRFSEFKVLILLRGFPSITFPLSRRPIEGQPIGELFTKQVRMNRHMELQFKVECLQDVAVVNCSGRMVRGAALDEFRRRIEQLERVRVLVLDVSEVDHLDAGGLGTLLLLRRWATQRSAKMKLVNPPVFFRRVLEATHLTSVFEISSLREAISILRANECQPARYAIA